MNVTDSNNPFYWYARCFQRFADFEGRARRKEYWWFTLINIVIVVLLSVLGSQLAADPGGLGAMIPMVLYLVVAFIPSLAVTVRRLHDTGRSGLWILLQFVPYVGPVVLFVFEVLPGDSGSNGYGHSPKVAPVDLGELETVFS